MDKVVQVVKLDERSKYTTLWPLGRVEVGGRAFFWDTSPEDDQ